MVVEMWHRWFQAICLSVLIGGFASAYATAEEVDPGEVLVRSFEHQYTHDMARTVRLIQKDSGGQERVTSLEMAQKIIEGKVHLLTRFLKPDSLRGMRILSIEADDRSDDHFIFLKSQQRVRRVRTTRQDAFLGTDFSMEDMEKRSLEDFQLTMLEEAMLDGESVYQIKAVPVYESGYGYLVYVIAKSDYSNLLIRYYKKDTEKPVKELRVPRKSIEAFKDVLIGRHAYVTNFARSTETHVYVDKLVIDPELDDSLFSSVSLDSNRRIPGL